MPNVAVSIFYHSNIVFATTFSNFFKKDSVNTVSPASERKRERNDREKESCFAPHPELEGGKVAPLVF